MALLYLYRISKCLSLYQLNELYKLYKLNKLYELNKLHDAILFTVGLKESEHHVVE